MIKYMLDHIFRSPIRLYARLHTRSNDNKFYDYSITIALFFGMSFDKQVIVKTYL